MKEYRLAAWTTLPAPFHLTAHSRMLTDLSHRHMTLDQLARVSGLRKPEVQMFLDMLDSRGLLVERDLFGNVSDSMFDSMFDTLKPLVSPIVKPLSGLIRKALHT